MSRLLTPSRQRGIEYLDARDVDPVLRRRAHRDLQLSNVLLGANRALLTEFERILPSLQGQATLLDVGTGASDIPAKAMRVAARHGIELTAVGLDSVPELMATTTQRIPMGVGGNALALPFRDHCIDVVCCSQVLHHFEEPDAITLLREMHRVARRYVIVSDLRRNRLAVAGLWAVSFPLRFHPVSRHDGIVSILRGFATGELRSMVRRAVGAEADIRTRLGFRVTATWATCGLSVLGKGPAVVDAAPVTGRGHEAWHLKAR